MRATAARPSGARVRRLLLNPLAYVFRTPFSDPERHHAPCAGGRSRRLLLQRRGCLPRGGDREVGAGLPALPQWDGAAGRRDCHRPDREASALLASQVTGLSGGDVSVAPTALRPLKSTRSSYRSLGCRRCACSVWRASSPGLQHSRPRFSAHGRWVELPDASRSAASSYRDGSHVRWSCHLCPCPEVSAGTRRFPAGDTGGTILLNVPSIPRKAALLRLPFTLGPRAIACG